MTKVPLAQARQQLSGLLDRIQAGAELWLERLRRLHHEAGHGRLIDAYRLGLLPVTLDRDLAEAAGALSYPVETLELPETPCFTSKDWGAASRKPSCS